MTTQPTPGPQRYFTQEAVDKLIAAANARAFFCVTCHNWQLKASHRHDETGHDKAPR